VADSPSPYAPGIIADERTPPRPAGRAVVFLVAAFVMAVVTSGPLWNEWIGRSLQLTGRGPETLGLIYGIGSAAGILTLLWAYLSDAVPLWGTRREGYVILTGMLTAIAWIGIAVASSAIAAWIVGAALLGLLASVSRAAVLGALAEIGQRGSSTGRLAAAYAGVAQIGVLAATPLSLTWTYAPFPLPLTAGVAAGLCLAVVAVAATLSDRASPSPHPRVESIRLRAFFRSRPFGTSACVLACAGIAAMPRELLKKQSEHLYGPYLAWWSSLTVPALVILGAAVYLLACRRVAFGVLLRATLFGKALALVALASPGANDLAFIGFSVAETVADVALFDLALRVAPRGREAFGTVLLFGLPRVAGAVAYGLEGVFQTSAREGAAFGAVVGVLAVLAVSLLPPEITGTKDSR
jgi:MFS family permease